MTYAFRAVLYTLRSRALLNAILGYALCLLFVELVAIVLLFALAFVPQALALKANGFAAFWAWCVAALLTLAEILLAVWLIFAQLPTRCRREVAAA